MSGETFSLLQVFVAICATLFVSLMAKMSLREILITTGIPAAAVFTTFAFIIYDSGNLDVLEFLWLGAVIHLLIAAIAKAFLFPKKLLPPLHEGAVLLMFLTFLYCILSIENAFARALLVAIAIVLGGILLWEVFSDQPLSDGSRFFLGILVSVMSLAICLHQLSFLEDIFRLAEDQHPPLRLLMQSFGVQVTGFWALFHGIPLVANLAYDMVAPQTIVFYSLLLSPFITETLGKVLGLAKTPTRP